MQARQLDNVARARFPRVMYVHTRLAHAATASRQLPTSDCFKRRYLSEVHNTKTDNTDTRFMGTSHDLVPR